MTAIVDREKCTGCGECVSSCPLDAIAVDAVLPCDGGKAGIDSDLCGECGACIDVCPVSAISLQE